MLLGHILREQEYLRYIHLLHIVLDQLLNLLPVDEISAVQVLVQGGDGDIVRHAEHAHDTAAAAVLRKQGDALVNGVLGAVDFQFLAFVEDLPLAVAADAENALHQLRALRAHQSAHA